MTITETPAFRPFDNKQLQADNRLALFKHHAPHLATLGITNIQNFACKTPKSTSNGFCIAVFENEFQKEDGMYVQPSHYDNSALNGIPFLLKVPANPYFKEEYVYTQVNGSPAYYVPVEEFEECHEQPAAPKRMLSTATLNSGSPANPVIIEQPIAAIKAKVVDIDLPTFEGLEEDYSTGSMTILDLAAIIWKKPVSNKAFLNKLIQQTFK